MASVLRRPAFWCAAVGAVGLLAAGLAVWLLHETKPSPEELAERALGAATLKDRQEAAIELARCGEQSIPLLRQVFVQSDTPEVRAPIAQGLGHHRDVDSLPRLIEAMEDPSPLVRGRAAVAVKRIVGLEVPFSADGSPQERQKAVAFYRKFWEDAQAPGSKFIEYMRDPTKASESAERTAAYAAAPPAKEPTPRNTQRGGVYR